MANLIIRFKGRGQRRQGGFTLLEALISLLILTAGLLAAYRFNSTTIAFSAESNVRAYALAMAEAKLEELRNFQNGAEFDALVVAGGDGAVNYASAALTRSWACEDLGLGDPAILCDSTLRKINITVAWDDKLGVEQSVALNSIIWRHNPGKGAKDLFLALNTNGNSVDGYLDGNGNIVKGAGEGGGTVIISDTTTYWPADGLEPGSTDTAFVPGDYWDIELFGDIFFTDDGLASVTVGDGPHLEASCDIVDSVGYAAMEEGILLDGNGKEVVDANRIEVLVEGGFVLEVVVDVNGDPVLDAGGNLQRVVARDIDETAIKSVVDFQVYENGAWLFDVYGNPVRYQNSIDSPADDERYVARYIVEGDIRTLVYYKASLIALAEGTGGFKYRCEILGVPDGESWSGTLTYTAAGNDGICTPAPENSVHSVDVTVFNDPGDGSGNENITTSHDDLAVVVMTNAGSCPKIVK